MPLQGFMNPEKHLAGAARRVEYWAQPQTRSNIIGLRVGY